MIRLRLRWLIPVLAAIFVVPVAGAPAQPGDAARPAVAPFPGTMSDDLGFDRDDFPP